MSFVSIYLTIGFVVAGLGFWIASTEGMLEEAGLAKDHPQYPLFIALFTFLLLIGWPMLIISIINSIVNGNREDGDE